MSETSNPRRDGPPVDTESDPIERRDLIKTFLGVGLIAGLQGCVGRRGPVPSGTPNAEVERSAATEAGVRSEAPDAEAGDPALPTTEHTHPAAGDRLVYAFGEREGAPIRAADLEVGAPQVFAVPMDADGSHVADESRLNDVMLVRLDPSRLSEETAALAADGIVAYSAVCTHTGCEISDWDEEATRFQCPCHESEFDPADNGRVVGGPARRRLAALPLRIEDGLLVVTGGFTGRVGAEQPWERL